MLNVAPAPRNAVCIRFADGTVGKLVCGYLRSYQNIPAVSRVVTRVAFCLAHSDRSRATPLLSNTVNHRTVVQEGNEVRLSFVRAHVKKD